MAGAGRKVLCRRAACRAGRRREGVLKGRVRTLERQLETATTPITIPIIRKEYAISDAELKAKLDFLTTRNAALSAIVEQKEKEIGEHVFLIRQLRGKVHGLEQRLSGAKGQV